jgi:hypothetical protein
MTHTNRQGDDRPGVGRYEIRLSGHLHERHRDDGTTVISGPLVDQAALHGLLQRVRDLGLPLISVTELDSTEHERN